MNGKESDQISIIKKKKVKRKARTKKHKDIKVSETLVLVEMYNIKIKGKITMCYDYV